MNTNDFAYLIIVSLFNGLWFVVGVLFLFNQISRYKHNKELRTLKKEVERSLKKDISYYLSKQEESIKKLRRKQNV